MELQDLIVSVKALSIPEHTQRALLEDYLQFLESSSIERFMKFEQRIKTDLGFIEQALAQTKAAMIGSTLLLTLSKEIDFKALIGACFPPAFQDEELRELRNELISRALSMNKDVPAMAGLKRELIHTRKQLFFDL